MTQANFLTFDLKFQGFPQAIAAYAFPHPGGVALIECGPGSTLPALQTALDAHGYKLEQITDVLLTHIHLDHAGAAGALAHRGAIVHVHPRGAPHLINPEKLLSSAQRIYGDQMDTLWGEFLAVPEDRLHIIEDQQEILVGGRAFLPLDTPGHANHHMVFIHEDTAFTGDVGGVRLPGPAHLRLPMPPPDLHFGLWRESIVKLRQARPQRIAPTHFSVYDDADWHLGEVERQLDLNEAWLERIMQDDPEVPEINRRFLAWTEELADDAGLSRQLRDTYEAANPSWMVAAGVHRYWTKTRLNS